ncbi:MAG: GIY-YIG nuclease family protein [Candidatus Omnitrophica bacterium]|nr:GIY-YIG nuclease family protein [Candidatus Omnitrophota bacterium]
MYYLYIIKCSDQSLYTGITTDITRRIKEHNAGKGGKYTRAKCPVNLMYKELHKNRSEAQIREAYIKSWTRAKKLKLFTK